MNQSIKKETTWSDRSHEKLWEALGVKLHFCVNSFFDFVIYLNGF